MPVSSFYRAPTATINKADIKIGFKCQCKYAADQTYYDAVVSFLNCIHKSNHLLTRTIFQVTAITDYGFLVTYTQYGNSEEVPLEYLRQLNNAPKKEAKKKWDGTSLIPIPDNLKILPTDTEEVGQFS